MPPELFYRRHEKILRLMAREALEKICGEYRLHSEVSEGSQGSLEIRIDTIHILWQEPEHFLSRSWPFD